MVTIRDCLSPAPLYNVLKPVALAEIHHALTDMRDIPQGLINWGSVTGATPASLEARLVWVKCCPKQAASIIRAKTPLTVKRSDIFICKSPLCLEPVL